MQSNSQLLSEFLQDQERQSGLRFVSSQPYVSHRQLTQKKNNEHLMNIAKLDGVISKIKTKRF